MNGSECLKSIIYFTLWIFACLKIYDMVQLSTSNGFTDKLVELRSGRSRVQRPLKPINDICVSLRIIVIVQCCCKMLRSLRGA